MQGVNLPCCGFKDRHMEIRFSCGVCGQHLAADDQDVGQQFQCPSCTKTVTVPPPAARVPKPELSRKDKVTASPKPRGMSQTKGAPPAIKKKHSGLGLTAFLTSLVAGSILMIPVIWPASVGTVSPVVLMLLVFALAFLCLLSLGLGIFAICQKERKKLWGILGTVGSAAALVLAAFRMIQGF
jgi:hypothetical protein